MILVLFNFSFMASDSGSIDQLSQQRIYVLEPFEKYNTNVLNFFCRAEHEWTG